MAGDPEIYKKGEKTRFSGERAVEAARKSAEVRQERKTLKEELLLLLSEGDMQKNAAVALVNEVLAGNVKAFEVMRDTIGEKPKDMVEMDMQAKGFDVTITVVDEA